MATKLAPLRSRLTTLRRQRWTQRVIHGAMAFAFLLLAALAADFLLDWMLAFSRPVRIVILGFFGGLSIWAFRKFLWPALAVRESDLDVALLVERCQGIDSDLVAALQFESPEAATWGSPRLAATVVDRVAEFGNSLDVKRGLPPGRNRVGYALAGLAFLLLAASAVFPDHVRTFADRILLGSAHYPTRTHITRIAVNGSHADESPSRPRIPFGGAAHFEVEAAGVCPASGSIQIVADASGESVVVNLVPVNDSKIQASTSDPRSESTKTYTAELARLTAPVNYQVFLGDAWTEPAVLDVIPPPVVSLELEYSPPAYAASGSNSATRTSSRQISVIEGAHVSLTIGCDNKPLSTVELVVSGVSFPLEPQEGEHVWKLPATGTPLARAITPVPFEVHVVDSDGIAPEAPLRGHIRIEADRPPRIAAAVVTEKVLPSARPAITWGAADDYGVAEVRRYQQIVRSAGQIEQSVAVVERIGDSAAPRKTLRGRLELDLAPLGLAKGDQVRVTLEAVDYRGEQRGMAVESEPVVFQVTDESGILAGLVEADEKSARQLDEIIQRQLGAGDIAK